MDNISEGLRVCKDINHHKFVYYNWVIVLKQFYGKEEIDIHTRDTECYKTKMATFKAALEYFEEDHNWSQPERSTWDIEIETLIEFRVCNCN